MRHLKLFGSILVGPSAALLLLALAWSFNERLKPPPMMPRPPIRAIPDSLDERYLEILKLYLTRSDFGAFRGAKGTRYPETAETMIGLEGLDNLHACIRSVIREKVPGDILEAGAWRGGACIFARAALKAYGDEARNVWVADSFEGLPKPDASRYPVDAQGQPIWKLNYVLAVSETEVRENFRRYGLLDDRVKFLHGWFKDTLPAAPIGRLAILRADGDMYESTIQTLEPLYDKVSPGGYIISDDYFWIEGTRRAVDDFRRARGITEPISKVGVNCGYWRKPMRATESVRP